MVLSRVDLVKEIREIIAEELDLDLNEVKEDSKLDEDLGTYSLDMDGLVMVIKEKYDIILTNEEVDGVRTVKDIIDLVEVKV
jgi:acyl carrier protein